MTITTEEAERLAELHEHDAARFASGMPGREFRQHTAAALRDLAAERDYLEKIAIQAAQCHARETARADKLQAENARLREALKHYAETYCEQGESSEVCGRLYPEDCGGCRARTALGEKE
jgi:hypothetical protein